MTIKMSQSTCCDATYRFGRLVTPSRRNVSRQPTGPVLTNWPCCAFKTLYNKRMNRKFVGVTLLDDKTVESVNENQLATILKTSSAPVMVDVWADWCGPCEMQAPVLKELSDAHGDTIRVVKIEIENAPTLVKTFGIAHVPTILVFEKGKPVNKLVGFQSKQQLETCFKTVDLSAGSNIYAGK